MRRLLIGATLTFALMGCGDDSGDDDDDPTSDGAVPADGGGAAGDAGRDAGGGGMDASTDAGGGNIDSGTDAARPADAAADAARSDASTVDAGGGLDSGAADAGGGPVVDAGGDAGPETFASLYSSIFMENCSGCHGSNHRSGLDLSSAQAGYDSLINKAPGTDERGAGSACKTSGLLRVTPGNAAASLLVAKIEPSPPCGARMPINRDVLSGADIARVRAWVTAGAPR